MHVGNDIKKYFKVLVILNAHKWQSEYINDKCRTKCCDSGYDFVLLTS